MGSFSCIINNINVVTITYVCQVCGGNSRGDDSRTSGPTSVGSFSCIIIYIIMLNCNNYVCMSSMFELYNHVCRMVFSSL